jgi:hypothetical protein
MQQLITKVTYRAYRITASTKFFAIILGLFVAQSVWLAFTAIYPLPFDEYMHVGVIQIYARQWTPFIAQQPPEASLYGDITRTGSYLYHYLMSFPYRLLDVFFDSQTALVIGLRLMNVLMVVAALVLFRQLFIMWKIPRRIMHVAFLVFVFTPIVPFVAAHVNYDNLILLLTPIVLILGTRLIIDKGDVAWNGMLYVIFGAGAMLAKETFVPLFMVISLYVVWRLWREHGIKFLHELRASLAKNSKHVSFVLALLAFLVMGGLVVERYAGNFVRHGTFLVECEVVQPDHVCQDFGPWYRDHVTNVQNRPAEAPYGNPISFSQYWVTRMMRGYFANFAHTPTRVVSEMEPYGPIVARPLLPLPITVGYAALAGGLVAVVWQRRKIWNKPALRLMFIVCGAYAAVVWAFNYNSYLEIWKAEAIQARYTYPILLLLFVLFIQSVNWSIASKKVKSSFVLLLVPLYLWGGGIAGWLIRADDTWRWQNSTVQTVNHKLQSILRATIIH